MNAARRCAAKVGFPPFGRPGIVCHRNGRRTMAKDGRIRCADLLRIPGVMVFEKRHQRYQIVFACSRSPV